MTKSPNGIRIEVFRSGTFTPMVGGPVNYSAADLSGIASNYDPEISPAPIVIGHPSTDAPAYGWVKGFEYDADADILFADIGEVEPAFAEQIKSGRYKNISMSWFVPGASNNPAPGSWYPKHVGFLGAAAPAVSGLKPVAFAASKEGETITFEAAFGEPAFEDTASLFRGLREWIIGKFGTEEADKVLPSYKIDWISDATITQPEPLSPRFSEPEPKDTGMTKEEIAALEKREATVKAQEAEFAARDTKAREAENASFAEKLVTDKKLLPAKKADVVALLNAVPVDQSVSFSEGGEKTLLDGLKAILESQPTVVSFGAADLGDDPDKVQSADFASDNKPIAKDQLATDKKARAYQSQHPGTSYIDAVKAVS